MGKNINKVVLFVNFSTSARLRIIENQISVAFVFNFELYIKLKQRHIH